MGNLNFIWKVPLDAREAQHAKATVFIQIKYLNSYPGKYKRASPRKISTFLQAQNSPFATYIKISIGIYQQQYETYKPLKETRCSSNIHIRLTKPPSRLANIEWKPATNRVQQVFE